MLGGIDPKKPSVKLTASLHLKMDGWKTIRLIFLGGQPAAFSGAKMLLVFGVQKLVGPWVQGGQPYTKEKGFGKMRA